MERPSVSSQNLEKLHINIDTFLFSCFETDTARRKKDGTFSSHLRYEPFLFGAFKPNRRKGMKGFLGDLADILAHHAQAIPHYRRGDQVTIDTLAWFTQSMTTILFDIEALLHDYCGINLPEWPAALSAVADDLPQLDSLMKEYASYQATLRKAKKEEEAPAFDSPIKTPEQRAELAKEIWHLVATELKKTFGPYADLMVAFAAWKHTPKAAPEKIDWRVRPPVGDAFERYQRELNPLPPRGGRRERGGNDRGDRHGGDRPDRREGNGEDRPRRSFRDQDGESSPRREESREKPARDDRGGRPQHGREDRGGRGPRDERPNRDRRERGEFRDRHDRRPHHENGPRKSDPEELEGALQAARDAVEILQRNPEIMEVPLKPVNSFLRRQQHMIIIEAGFGTESRGEGAGRCVFVQREASETERE